MHFEVDTHTHTVLSGHAHSTIMENAAAAAQNGVKGFVMSDHGPSIHAAPPEYNINTFTFIPHYLNGVRVYRGIEANITGFKGVLDIRDAYLKKLEFVIAGIHEVVLPTGGAKRDTGAVLAAMNNKYVDIIAHPHNPNYAIALEALVREAARLGKLVEINDHSIGRKKESARNAALLLEMCKKHGVRIAVASDAHFAFGIGRFDSALELIEASGFPVSLIVNATAGSFESYLEERKARTAEIQ